MYYLMQQDTKLIFSKYQGCGNDFIMIDDRAGTWSERLDAETIAWLCHRQFGIGADGLLFVKHHAGALPQMIYYNSDGCESTFCGNGGRCFAAFLRELGYPGDDMLFQATDGLHSVGFNPDGTITLAMGDPVIHHHSPERCRIDTGSPHVVIRKETDIRGLPILEEGSAVRYDPAYAPGGVNANFVFSQNGVHYLRTYERGVENETLSCGTGACAAAVSLALWDKSGGPVEYSLQTPGGILKVSMIKTETGIRNVQLTGDAKKVFTGAVQLVI
jgi:diaminopimelate epimerase